MDLEERINQLEVKITHMEDYIEKLNSVIIGQNENINDLKKALEILEDNLNIDNGSNLPYEKPPHY